MPQDLKLELDQLTVKESVTGGCLPGLSGGKRTRPPDGLGNTRSSWQKELAGNRTNNLDAPSWLWTSVVGLLWRTKRRTSNTAGCTRSKTNSPDRTISRSRLTHS